MAWCSGASTATLKPTWLKAHFTLNPHPYVTLQLSTVSGLWLVAIFYDAVVHLKVQGHLLTQDSLARENPFRLARQWKFCLALSRSPADQLLISWPSLSIDRLGLLGLRLFSTASKSETHLLDFSLFRNFSPPNFSSILTEQMTLLGTLYAAYYQHHFRSP